MRPIRLFPRSLLLGVAFAAVCAVSAHAGLPVGKQVAVAVRALAYDRTLKARVGPHLDVLVVHDGTAVATRAAADVEQGLAALSGVVVQGATMQASVVAIVDHNALKAALDARAPDAIWVCGSATLADAAIAEARGRHLTTITVELALLESGIMVAVDGSGDKPKLIVHLGEARAAGLDFAADLLKLARVIR